MNTAFLLLLCFLAAGGSPGFPQSSSAARVESHLERARQAEQTKDYARAAKEYIQILKLAPRSAEIHEKLGLAYHLQSKYEAAVGAFEKALELEPNRWPSRLFAGIGYYKTNQFSRAVPSLQKALALNSKDAEFEGRFWLGVSYVALGRYGAGIEEFQRLVRIKPGDVELSYYLAQANRKYSAQLFDRLLRTAPDSARVYQLQAESYRASEMQEEAIEEYKLALSREPGLEGIHLELGRIHRELGRIERAAEEFHGELRVNPYDEAAKLALKEIGREQAPSPSGQETRVNKTDPDAPEVKSFNPQSEISNPKSAHVLMQRGISDFHRLQWKEAAAAFDKVLALSPEEKRARLYLARCFTRLGDSEKALEVAQPLSEKIDLDAEALYSLGKLHSELASMYLQQMIDLQPNSYRVHQLLGEDFEKKQVYPRALESYKAAYALEPGLPGMRFSIGSIYWKMRQFDEAVRWLREELESNPHHALAHYQLGNIYAYRGQASEALPHLRQAVRANPEFTEARRELGKALAHMGQYEEAIEHFKFVARAEPEDDAIHALLANAYRKQGRPGEAEAEMDLYRRLQQKRLEQAQKRAGQVHN